MKLRFFLLPIFTFQSILTNVLWNKTFKNATIWFFKNPYRYINYQDSDIESHLFNWPATVNLFCLILDFFFLQVLFDIISFYFNFTSNHHLYEITFVPIKNSHVVSFTSFIHSILCVFWRTLWTDYKTVVCKIFIINWFCANIFSFFVFVWLYINMRH